MNMRLLLAVGWPDGLQNDSGEKRDLHHLEQCGMWDVGCGMWDVGCGMWDVGCGMWDVGCGMWANAVES